MGNLDGKVAIITGAAKGMGEATARLFIEQGASVLLTDVLERGQAVADELGERAVFMQMDVSKEEDWTRAVARAEQLGPINVLVNNAAILFVRAIEDTTVEDYLKVISINQMGAFLGIKAVTASMKTAGGGSIINISSIDGMQSKNGLMAYSSAKWAVRGITKCAAIELGVHGIRVNSVHPGGILTDMHAGEGDPNAWYSQHAIPRVGQPREVAQMTAYLASDAASYSSGAEFLVDGGWNAGMRLPVMPGG